MNLILTRIPGIENSRYALLAAFFCKGAKVRDSIILQPADVFFFISIQKESGWDPGFHSSVLDPIRFLFISLSSIEFPSCIHKFYMLHILSGPALMQL